MLLLSGVSREDGELVEFNAVLEGQPGTYERALVLLAVCTDPPQILGVHLVNNLVSLSLQLANNKAMEQFVRLLGFSNRDTLLGLENFLILEKLWLLLL
jgi:hypothetical protein